MLDGRHLEKSKNGHISATVSPTDLYCAIPYTKSLLFYVKKIPKSYKNWPQLLFFVKAAALKQEISKFIRKF